MKLSLFGRMALAVLASAALGLGMTACGGGTIGYIWVTGQQYNQIAGFKVDDYTGNLTAVPSSPFGSGGTKPVSILVRAGGRYVYVLNQGTGGSIKGAGSSSGISVFAVGGDGVLTYQSTFYSQGYVPVWMQFDSTNSFLYVLDKYASSGDGNGSITVFSIDPNTGRLALVTNSSNQVNGVNTTYYETGVAPIMMKSTGSCLLVANGGDQSITPFGVTSGTGQLAYETNVGKIATGATTISSINGSGSYVFVTDSGANKIFTYSLSSASCNLSPINGGSLANLAGTSNPTYSFLDNSGKYLYVLNSVNTSPSPTAVYSSISAFVINSTNSTLSPVSTSTFTVGAGPVCMVEDTSNQYVYVSNYNDGTITGKKIDNTTGNLSDLNRGSTFTATGLAGCLVLSGNVS